jgi:hypothetical protein
MLTTTNRIYFFPMAAITLFIIEGFDIYLNMALGPFACTSAIAAATSGSS